jgi:hypothetical protein
MISRTLYTRGTRGFGIYYYGHSISMVEHINSYKYHMTRMRDIE